MSALLEPYGISIDANTALRAVPHERALHPAEPLVADGVLTTALAAALGQCANHKVGPAAWVRGRPVGPALLRPGARVRLVRS